MIAITPEQRRSLQEGSAVRAIDTELGEVVVCPKSLFEVLQSCLDDEQERQAIVKYGKSVTSKRLQEEEDGRF